MARQLTEEQREERRLFDEMIAKMKMDYNGCPLFEGREKGQLEDLVGKQLTIEQIFPMSDYHAITFEEIPDFVYLTGGALKQLCNEYEEKYVIGRVIEIGKLVKVKGDARKQFRPIRVIA